MLRIKDKVTICWTDKDGNPINEEVITYEPDEKEEKESKVSSVLSFTAMHLEAVSMDKLILVLILDDALEKLGILKCTAQKEHTPIPFLIPEYKTIDERFGQVLQYEEDMYSESKKRYSDLTMIYSILYKTLEDLAENGSYAPLGEATRVIKNLFEDEDNLIREEEESRTMEEDYKRKVKNQKKQLDAENREKLEALRQLELAHEDAIAYGKLEFRYLDSWEDARRHQARFIQEREENAFLDVISNSQTQIDLENRIHGELVKFFDENAEDLNNDIQFWMYRYESETESRDQELLKLQMDREAQAEKYQKLKATYELQKEFIDEWWIEKEKARIIAEQLARETYAAIVIQRWWRNIMIRKKFYRKRKGKGKGKGKKKK